MGDSEHPPSSDAEFDPFTEIDSLDVTSDNPPPLADDSGADSSFPFEPAEASLTPPPKAQSDEPGARQPSREAATRHARVARSMPPPLPPVQPLPAVQASPRIVVQGARPVPRGFLDMTPTAWGVAITFAIAGLVGGYALRPHVPGGELSRSATGRDDGARPAFGKPGANPSGVAPQAPGSTATPAPPGDAPPVAAVVDVAPAITQDTSPSGCIASHFPAGSFKVKPDFEHVCSGTNVWKIAEQIGKDVEASGSPAAAESWRSLGWYELATTAMIRHQCCESPAPLTAATPSGKCAGFDETLVALASDPTPKSRRAHQDVLDCLVKKAVPSPSRFRKIDLDDAASAFVGFRP